MSEAGSVNGASGVSRFDIAGKVVLVTGAGRGLGQGIAVAFAAAGAKVLTVSRTASELEQTSSLIAEVGPPATEIVADLTDLDGLKDLASRLWEVHGRIDVAVQSAGRRSTTSPSASPVVVVVPSTRSAR